MSYDPVNMFEVLCRKYDDKTAEMIAIKSDDQWLYEDFLKVKECDTSLAVTLTDYFATYILFNTHSWGLGLFDIQQMKNYKV